MSQDQVAAIEKQVRNSKKLIDAGESLTRLYSNRDFRKLVLDGYFREEAIRLVHAKADPAFQTAASQLDLDNQIGAIGAVASYLRQVRQQAEIAAAQLGGQEAMLEELAEEGEV